MAEHSLQASILTKLLSRLIPVETLSLYDSLDWDAAIAPFTSTRTSYPEYYSSQNFHGIEQGYLNPIAPITYDFVAAIATPPHEIRVRQVLLDHIDGTPNTILDLGCGTGTGTLMLRQKCPNAQVVGFDLSPYMLVMAEHKAYQAGVKNIQWQRGLAEATEFDPNSFDLITISMVFHETPLTVMERILTECDRILKPGGQLIILDGHQQKLRHLKWLTQLFREPYSYAYATGDLDGSLIAQGFHAVSTQSVGWINQLTVGYKQPL